MKKQFLFLLSLICLTGCTTITETNSEKLSQNKVETQKTLEDKNYIETEPATVFSDVSDAIQNTVINDEFNSVSKKEILNTSFLDKNIYSISTTTITSNNLILESSNSIIDKKDSVNIDNEKLTEKEWIEKASDFYEKAQETAFLYLCSNQSIYTYDMTSVYENKYFLITNFSSLYQATIGYYDVFSREKHLSDFDDFLLEKDGVLYGTASERGEDVTYSGFDISELISESDTEVIFNVISSYTDGEKEENIFSLVLEDDIWKVGEFTLAY